MESYYSNIGKQVYKRSNKPFKSGSKINTVKAVMINPNTFKPAYAFEEDNSIVDAFICRLVENE